MLWPGSSVLEMMESGTRSGVARLLAPGLALFLSACGTADVDGNVTGGDGTEAASSTQALGGWTTLRTSSFPRPLHLGPRVAVLDGDSLCADAEFVDRATGGVLFTEGAFCPLAFGSDETTVFMAGVTAFPVVKIYSRDLVVGATWREVTTLNGALGNRFTILVDATHVYWDDGGIITRAPRGGGAQVALNSGSARFLRGLDGNTLYYYDYQGRSMGRMKVDGSGDGVLPGVSSLEELSFDSTYIYGTASEHGKMYRINKSTLAVAILGDASGRTYHHPISTGSMLYWFEDRSSTGVVARRRNLTNNNVVTVDFPYPDAPNFMNLYDNKMYVLTRATVDGVPQGLLIRGTP